MFSGASSFLLKCHWSVEVGEGCALVGLDLKEMDYVLRINTEFVIGLPHVHTCT